MYIYIYIHKHTYMYAYIYIYIHIHIHAVVCLCVVCWCMCLCVLCVCLSLNPLNIPMDSACASACARARVRQGSFRPEATKSDSLRGSCVKIGTIQRRLAWPLRKDYTHKSRSVNIVYVMLRAKVIAGGRQFGRWNIRVFGWTGEPMSLLFCSNWKPRCLNDGCFDGKVTPINMLIHPTKQIHCLVSFPWMRNFCNS